MSTSTTKPLLSLVEVAALLDWPVGRVRARARRGALGVPLVRPGGPRGQILVRRTDLEQMLFGEAAQPA